MIIVYYCSTAYLGLTHPRFAAGSLAAWVVGRVVYTIGYSTGNPKRVSISLVNSALKLTICSQQRMAGSVLSGLPSLGEPFFTPINSNSNEVYSNNFGFRLGRIPVYTSSFVITPIIIMVSRLPALINASHCKQGVYITRHISETIYPPPHDVWVTF